MAQKPKTVSSSDFKNTKDEKEYNKKDVDDVEDIEDDDEQDNYEKPKKKGKQVEINPPLANVDESIEFLPEALQDDAIDSCAEDLLNDIMETLQEVSVQSEYDFETLLEVFKRGFAQNFNEILTEDFDYLDKAFLRVESFVNGGLASKVDCDLLNENAGLSGTDELVQNYREVTPGQKLILKIKDKKNV